MSFNSMARAIVVVLVCITVTRVISIAGGEDSEKVPAKQSRVVSLDEAKSTVGDWGEFKIHLRGETAMTTSSFAGICRVLPGKAVHPAHRHAEEEYLVITEGEGVWTLDDQEIPAKKGDVLYVEPWVFHGLSNTGERDLVFFVVKYASKGVAPAREPLGSHGS